MKCFFYFTTKYLIYYGIMLVIINGMVGKRMTSKKWLNGFAILLIIVGLAFLMRGYFEGFLIKRVTNDNQFNQISVETIRENEMIEGEFEFDQTANLTWEHILNGYQNREDLPVIGGLSIPSIALQLPILKGLAESNLVAGAGTMAADQRMGQGNYSLAGHNYARNQILFSDIPYMTIGDTIYITDMETIYVYELNWLEMVTPDRVDLVEEVPGRKMITLITCSLDLTMRWVGQGDLVETVAVADASAELLAALNLIEE